MFPTQILSTVRNPPTNTFGLTHGFPGVTENQQCRTAIGSTWSVPGRQGSVDWCPRNTTLWHEASIAKNCGETATWVCAGSTLSDETHLDFQKLQRNWAFCVSMVLHSPSRTKCVSMVKAEVILRFFAFEWFCADTLALNAVKKRWSCVFLVLCNPMCVHRRNSD